MKDIPSKIQSLDLFSFSMAIMISTIPAYLLWVLYGDVGLEEGLRNWLTGFSFVALAFLCALNVAQLKSRSDDTRNTVDNSNKT